MATSQISLEVSRYIRNLLEVTGTPHNEAAKWVGIPPANLSQRLSGGVEWRLSELSEFSQQVFGLSLTSFLEAALSQNEGPKFLNEKNPCRL